MGRIHEPALRSFAERWSPTIITLLDELGIRIWKPKKIRRGLLHKPEIVMRHLVEGPLHEGSTLRWALSHTSIPSAFDDAGILSEGQREYWLIVYTADGQGKGTFQIIGADVISDIPPDEAALEAALEQAQQSGPKTETFYGNKGPLSHR